MQHAPPHLQQCQHRLSVHGLAVQINCEVAAMNWPINHALGESGSTFCAEKKLAAQLKKNFPRSLHGAPALLPSENTVLRRALEVWFREQRIQPRVVAECEDLGPQRSWPRKDADSSPCPPSR